MNLRVAARQRMLAIALGMAAVLIAMLLTAGPSAADERDHRRGIEHGRREVWHGEIHRFREYDFARWRAGRWYRGRHDGRHGWWWIVGGIWYFYPAPVYPYPDPYFPPGAVAPTAPAPAPGTPPRYWYYCSNPAGYYPYVPQCATAWQTVPANPPPPSAPVPSIPAPSGQQYWYYCTNPQGYYPSVPECPLGWQRVPANTPPGAVR